MHTVISVCYLLSVYLFCTEKQTPINNSALWVKGCRISYLTTLTLFILFYCGIRKIEAFSFSFLSYTKMSTVETE